MRQPIAFAAAAMALAALSAQAHAQSRYGPGPSTLSWPGKAAAQAKTTAPSVEPARPEPIAPWAQRMAALTPPSAAPLLPAAAPVATARPETAITPAAAPAPRALPSHLYDSPPPAPIAQTAPQQQTALLGAPAPRPLAAPLNPSAAAGPRFYSVYREYGVSPDAIPTAPQTSRGQETTLRETPSTPSLAGQDDTQYLPARPNSEAASRRTF
jgi:hypothetical protein